MWLKDSSIGRKFVMALSGAALVFFLLFHGCMNLALVFSEEAYNAICRFLGANWYAVIGPLCGNRQETGRDLGVGEHARAGLCDPRFPVLAPVQFLVQDAVCRTVGHRDGCV